MVSDEEISRFEYSETQKIISELEVEIIKIPFLFQKKNYYLLASSNFEKAKAIGVILPGIPEKIAFWSYTLLKNGDLHSSSKYPYFKSFIENGWALINLIPHLYYVDTIGTRYAEQLIYVLKNISTDAKVAIIGYSFGGKIITEIINSKKELLDKIDCLILLDPVISPEKLIKQHMKLNIASSIIYLSDEYLENYSIKPPNVEFINTISCKHGELPNYSLRHLRILRKKAPTL